jgi:hypothetical protein
LFPHHKNIVKFMPARAFQHELMLPDWCNPLILETASNLNWAGPTRAFWIDTCQQLLSFSLNKRWSGRFCFWGNFLAWLLCHDNICHSIMITLPC